MRDRLSLIYIFHKVMIHLYMYIDISHPIKEQERDWYWTGELERDRNEGRVDISKIVKENYPSRW